MEVYKKDLNEFIEKAEDKAVASIGKRYNEIINATKQERLDKIKPVIDSSIEKLNEVLKDLNILVDSMVFESWSNPVYGKNRVKDSIQYLHNTSLSSVRDTDEEEKINLKKYNEFCATQIEYNKVKIYIKNNTPIRGYKYLQELGFDVTSIATYDNNVSNSTALVTQIDTNKLFVCGERN